MGLLLFGLLLRPILASVPPAADGQSLIGPAPDWVTPTPCVTPAAPQPNPTGQDFLLLDQQVRLATGEAYTHQVYQIVSDSGRQNGGQISISFDPSYQELFLHHLRLVRGTEVLERLDPAKIQLIQQERDLDRQLYNGQRTALVILEDVRIGDCIDLAFTLRGRNPVFEGKFVDATFLEWAVPVRDLRYRMLTAPDRKIATKVVGTAKLTPQLREREGEQDVLWRRSDLPIIEGEERVPGAHTVFSFLDVSEFSSWQEVVRWAEPLYQLPATPDPQVAELTGKIRTKTASPEAQALAALDFVQQEIRYLGIQMGPGSHRPSEPGEVLRRRFGDCKDKSRLLVALLRGLGLEAAPALVHSYAREGLHSRLTTPYAFDHVIVSLDLGGHRYLLDPTLSYQRGEGLALRHLDRYGPYLRIAPADNYRLENPSPAAGDILDTEITSVFHVTDLGKPATLAIKTTYAGRAAENMRAYFANRTLDQISREYLNYFTPYYPGIRQTKPVEHRDSPVDNRYFVTEEYAVEQLFRAEAGDLLRAELQPTSMWDHTRMPNLAQRRLPLALSHPTRARERLTIHLPEEWKIDPQKDRVTDAAFELSHEVSQPDVRTVQLDYTWESKAHEVAPARMSEFARNTESARRNLGYQLTWNQNPAVAQPAGFHPNWSQIGLALGTVLAGLYASWRLVRKRNPTPAEPPPLSTESGPVDPYSYKARAAQETAGLGGWLLLVGFGLFIRPVWQIIALYEGRTGYFDAAVWERLTSPSSDAYNRYYGLLAPLELIVFLLLFIYSLLLLVLFFRRSYLFPRTIQIFFILQIAATLFTIANVRILNFEAVGYEHYQTLFQCCVAAAIWIPYFQVSRRVKLTFTR
ncbi:DUF3857 domain-containing protein [Oleiharenicola lentus]|nr:DUF3857 domain-containing protein [Oleiharenicola lentus]